MGFRSESSGKKIKYRDSDRQAAVARLAIQLAAGDRNDSPVGLGSPTRESFLSLCGPWDEQKGRFPDGLRIVDLPLRSANRDL